MDDGFRMESSVVVLDVDDVIFYVNEIDKKRIESINGVGSQYKYLETSPKDDVPKISSTSSCLIDSNKEIRLFSVK